MLCTHESAFPLSLWNPQARHDSIHPVALLVRKLKGCITILIYTPENFSNFTAISCLKLQIFGLERGTRVEYIRMPSSLGPRPLRGVRRSLRGLRRYEKGPGIHCSRMRQK